MALPDKKHSLLNISLRSLRKKAFEAYPFFKNTPETIVIIMKNTGIPDFSYGSFTEKKEYFPHTHFA